MRLGINKGDHDVSCSTGGRQPLVVVCEATGMHHGPTKTSVHNTAVVTNKSGTTSLVCVERGGGRKEVCGRWVQLQLCMRIHYTHITVAHRVVDIWCVEGNVDGKGGGVVVGSEAGLAIRVVLHNKVHHCMSLQKREGRQNVND